MSPELQKERAMEFVQLLDGRNPEPLGDLVADAFEFGLIARLQGNIAIDWANPVRSFWRCR